MRNCDKCGYMMHRIYTWFIPSLKRLRKKHGTATLYQCPKCKKVMVVEE